MGRSSCCKSHRPKRSLPFFRQNSSHPLTVRHRRLMLESLELRQLLSVNPDHQRDLADNGDGNRGLVGQPLGLAGDLQSEQPAGRRPDRLEASVRHRQQRIPGRFLP